jgi:hypothetical protein
MVAATGITLATKGCVEKSCYGTDRYSSGRTLPRGKVCFRSERAQVFNRNISQAAAWIVVYLLCCLQLIRYNLFGLNWAFAVSAKNQRLALVLGLIVVTVVLLSQVWYSVAHVSRPTKQEYAVYRALLQRVAMDSKKRVIAANHTSALSLPDYERSSPPTPVELRIARVQEAAFPDFDDFCGRCGKDFVAKNVRSWPLEPRLEYSAVSPGASVNDDAILVTLSRVGFNVWRSRAVVTFSADCSDSASSTICLEIGQAYLERKSEEWIVDRVSGNVF